MLDKLAKQGYIEHEAYKEIFLTKKVENSGKK
ncbi:Transcriptional regulator MntR (fragment) [groundwater metagenome]|uniref:Transcriptional regulator MntR n=1 Tax=groundwater metagenome TaxID=717931 RepID=A0A098ECA3_9ZZZZ